MTTDIDWTKIEGAYGPSGGGRNDVAAAIDALRSGPEDEDAFADALSLLYSHAWHQGSIYSVTARVLPFVFEIAERASNDTSGAYDELFGFIPLCACTARFSTDAHERDAAKEVLRALRAEKARLIAWTRTPLRAYAVATLLQVPELQSFVLTPSAEVSLAESDVLRIVLTQLGGGGISFDAKVLEWTATALDALRHEVASSAATMLRDAASTNTRPRSPPKLAALAEALVRNDPLDTVSDLFFPLRVPKR
jgi:hypothetical protein